MFRLPTHRGIVLLTILVSTGLSLVSFCTDDYNPFTDASNTKLFISGSFGEGDTIALFSTETLTVAIAVPELADSLVVSVPANRLFDNGSRVLSAGNRGTLSSGPYRLYVSMYDTGRQDIVLTLKRSNGETVTKSLSCYVQSPLVPKVVSGSYGAAVALVTSAVNDRDVLYRWDFGHEMVVTTAKPETTAVLNTSGPGKSGLLSVSDGYVSSPPVPFGYTLFDTIGPSVDFMDELYMMSGDTVITSDSLFFFRTIIKDRSTGGVDSASINGEPFDLINDSMYTKIINRMDTVLSPRRMTLYAIDNFQYYNDTSVTFYVRFDPEARAVSGLRLHLWVPPRDNTVFNTSTKRLMGTVEHIAGDSVHADLLITVNGREAATLTLRGKASVDWSASVTFDDSVNVVAVTARDSDGDSLAGLQRVVRVRNDVKDTVAPVIVAILSGSEHVDKTTVNETPVLIRVLAYDAAEGVEAVRFNGLETTSENSIVWEQTVDLMHLKGGNVIRVEATDHSGLSTDTSVVLYFNNRPVPVHTPDPPMPMFTGEMLQDSFIVSDPDGDSIIYSIDTDDTTVTIDARGYIRWRPERSDTGAHLFRLRAYDGYEEATHVMKVEVVEKDALQPGVRFSTTADEFPRWIEATVDTIRAVLQTVPGTGKDPLVYRAVRMSDGRPLTIRGDTLEVVPALRDTGRLQMRIVVTDRYSRSDTISPVVIIVPPNRQCRLNHVAGFDTVSGGVYNESDPSRTDTLLFGIEDPDIDLVEHFAVNAWRNGSPQGLVVDNRRQVRLVLRGTDKVGGFDTVTAVVTDRALHRDSVQIIVYYGMPPDTPVLLQPAYGGSVADSTVHFTWEGSDIDGNLTFRLLMGRCPGPLEEVATLLNDKIFSINSLRTSGRYCWQIIASDGKTEVSSDIGTFSLRVPDHVTFATTEADFPRALEALRDSLVVPLALKGGTGTSPFIYRALFAESGKTLLPDTALLRYLPTEQDTGMQRLVITVTDGDANSDTLFPQLLITPPNRPCSLSLEYGGTWLEEGVVDMSLRTSPDTLFFTVIDPDTSLTERHTVTVRQLNVVEVGSLDAQRSVSVILDPTKTTVERDTVSILVEDRAGHAASDTVEIYYGVR